VILYHQGHSASVTAAVRTLFELAGVPDQINSQAWGRAPWLLQTNQRCSSDTSHSHSAWIWVTRGRK